MPVRFHDPVLHNFALPCRPAVAKRWSSGENLRHSTPPLCASSRSVSGSTVFHSVVLPSRSPIARVWPSGENTAEVGARPLLGLIRRISRRVATSQILAVPSCPQDTSISPLGANDTLGTRVGGPGSFATRRRSRTSQRPIPSVQPDAASNLPSGEKDTDSTSGDAIISVGSFSTAASLKVLISHNLIEPSQLPEASLRPSGEYATKFTLRVCPMKVAISLPVTTLHSLTFLSKLAVASSEPSGEKLTDATLPV